MPTKLTSALMMSKMSVPNLVNATPTTSSATMPVNAAEMSMHSNSSTVTA